MQLLDRDKRDGYIYDPALKGLDTSFWKTISGTPAITGSGASSKIRLNAAEMATFLQHEYADIDFLVNVPVKPTAGDSRHWGFRIIGSTNPGAAYFDITGAVFTAKSVDSYGNAQTTTLTWSDPLYTATETNFRINWDKDTIFFYINGSIVATHVTNIPYTALPIDIKNGNSDNMDIGIVNVRKAAGII